MPCRRDALLAAWLPGTEGDGLTDDLVMSYQRDDGSYATVTRSVPLEAIVEAPTLRLKPAKSKKGRR